MDDDVCLFPRKWGSCLLVCLLAWHFYVCPGHSVLLGEGEAWRKHRLAIGPQAMPRVTSCDACLGWQSHSVTVQFNTAESACVPSAFTCKESAWAAQLFCSAVHCHIGCPLRIREQRLELIGGWWVPDGLESIRSPLAFSSLWFSCRAGSAHQGALQARVAAFEALAQLVLLPLRCEELPQHGSFLLLFSQLTGSPKRMDGFSQPQRGAAWSSATKAAHVCNIVTAMVLDKPFEGGTCRLAWPCVWTIARK